EDDIRTLWDFIQTDSKSSLLAYIEGWTGRILTETIGHKGALWVRLTGITKALMESSASLYLSHVKTLLNNSIGEEKLRIWEQTKIGHELFPVDAAIVYLQAEVARGVGEHEVEKDKLLEYVHMKGSQNDQKLNALKRLCEIFDEEGPLPNRQTHQEHALLIARFA